MVSTPSKILAILCLLLSTSCWSQPRHLYLTWERQNTANSQTIVFQTLDKATNPKVEIFVKKGGKPKVFPAKTVRLGNHSRRIHRVTITGLTAKTIYKFRAGDKRYGMSPWRTFKTLPKDDSPLKVITGGDLYSHRETVQLLAVGRTRAPDVALIGGDISYADGKLNRIAFWDQWLDNWQNYMNGKNGRIVPMILAIGNHEVNGAFGRTKSQAPFYFGFFPQGGEPYFRRDLGSEIDLIVLDSGHVTSHQSQRTFLESSLAKSQARFKVALYHVPCYPTHRPYEEQYSKQGRTHWVPLFDKYGLELALENHDHVFKRTHPLKGGKISSKGTVYLGDGCWGRTPRRVSAKRWYHVKASPTEHIWLLQNQAQNLRCTAIDKRGLVFDQTSIGKPRRKP